MAAELGKGSGEVKGPTGPKGPGGKSLNPEHGQEPGIPPLQPQSQDSTSSRLREKFASALPHVAAAVRPDQDAQSRRLQKVAEEGSGEDAALAAGVLHADRLPQRRAEPPKIVQRMLGISLDGLRTAAANLTTIADIGRPPQVQEAHQLGIARGEFGIENSLRDVGVEVFTEEKKAAEQAAAVARQQGAEDAAAAAEARAKVLKKKISGAG